MIKKLLEYEALISDIRKLIYALALFTLAWLGCSVFQLENELLERLLEYAALGFGIYLPTNSRGN